MKRILFALAILVCLAGTCIAEDLASVSGNYVSKKDGKEYLRLYPDGTFVLRQRKIPPSIDAPFEELTGKFSIRGEKITFNLSDGGEASGTLKNNTFEDVEGTPWVKEGSEQRQMPNVPHQSTHKQRSPF
jgi:hypothetical protein